MRQRPKTPSVPRLRDPKANLSRLNTFMQEVAQAIGDMAPPPKSKPHISATPAGVVLTVNGMLAIQSDVAPRVSLNTEARATGVVAEVKQEPVGAPLTLELYLDTTLWMTLTMEEGATRVQATPTQIAGASPIRAGRNIRLDITSVGTTSPGSDLTVMIYF